MKKLEHILSFALLILFTMLFCGCGNNNDTMTKLNDFLHPNSFSTTSSNSIIHQAQADAPEDTMLYIINDPTDVEMKELISYQLLKLDDNASTILLVPRRQNSIVKLYLLEFDEQSEDCERSGEAIWSTDSSDEGLVIAAEMQRGSSGQPHYEIYIESGSNYASYFFELPDEDAELPRFEYVQSQGQVIQIRGLD